MNQWLKLPGLFYRGEIDAVIDVDGEYEYTFLRAGRDNDEQDLVAIYCRLRRSSDGPQTLERRRRWNAVFDAEPTARKWP